MTREKLIELAKELGIKRIKVDNLARCNIAGASVEERVDMQAEYRVAQDEWLAAERAYASAMVAYTKETAK